MCTRELELFLNTKILVNHFKELCRTHLPPFREMNIWMNQRKAEVNTNMVFFLAQMKRLIHEDKVSAETFKNEIKKMKDLNLLKVEILWYLQVVTLLTLVEYIRYQEENEKEDIIEHISRQVFENLLEYSPNASKIREEMLVDWIKTFFECSKQSKENTKASYFRNLMNFIITNLKQLYSEEDTFDSETHIDISHFMKLCHNLDNHSDILKLFLQKILTGLMESSVQSIKSYFKKQEKLKNHVQDKKIFEFFRAISKYADLGFLVSELSMKLMDSSKGLNWDHMLCFITFIGVTYKDGWNELKKLNNSILKQAFKNLDVKLLSYAFLVARQGCFERVNSCFPSYLQWFSSSFSSESRRPINSKKICNFFFDFLTELSPYDSPYYLKIHINRVPWVPSDCLAIVNEYVAVVKAQLSDLNISVELGICENITNKSAAVFDVENVLKHFERTNDILSSVFQASMFCKDYYEKKFLTELLKKFDGKKSVRHKFILKLHSLGKIPNSMFKMYKALEKK